VAHPPVIAAWHDYMESGDFALLDALLDDDAVFESPVVHTPQRGKAITFKYLQSAAQVFGTESFAYVGEWFGDNSAILEFTDTLDGISVNGIDMIWWNDAGKITRFKVMVRPLKAVNMLHQKMGEMLAKGG
jgi:SnoaL-like domain